MKKRGKRYAACLLAGVMTLSLAACGSKSGGTDSSDSSGGGSGDVIKLGLCAPLTGANAEDVYKRHVQQPGDGRTVHDPAVQDKRAVFFRRLSGMLPKKLGKIADILDAAFGGHFRNLIFRQD